MSKMKNVQALFPCNLISFVLVRLNIVPFFYMDILAVCSAIRYDGCNELN
jgi:hypothetical protein